MSSILEINDLCINIHSKKIVNNVSFSLAEGEIVGVLGPNGAGKTTTIKAMAGLLNYDMDKNFEEYIRYIGFGFDRANYYPYLSGFDNLKMCCNVYRKCSKNEILSCAEEVGLSNRIYDKVSTYSFGMRQRLNFAKAILMNAKIIVFDEPFNGIDPAGVVDMRNQILQLKKDRGMSFIISSHLLHEIENLSDRILFFKKGEIVKDIYLKDYLMHNHYLKISEVENWDELIKSMNSYEVEILEENLIRVKAFEKDFHEILQCLINNKVKIQSVVSKREIEDLYMHTVGGGQVD